MPPNGVLGLGLESGGKAFAGDWGLLKAELREVGKPCMLWVWEVAVPPRLNEPMPDRGSISRRQKESIRTLLCADQFDIWHVKLMLAEARCGFNVKIPVQEKWHPGCWCWERVPLALPPVVAAVLCSLHCCSWQPWSGSSLRAPGKHSYGKIWHKLKFIKSPNHQTHSTEDRPMLVTEPMMIEGCIVMMPSRKYDPLAQSNAGLYQQVAILVNCL